MSGHDNSHVLQGQTITTYISSPSGAVPFGQVNSTATFDFPSHTSANVTTYTDLVYIRSNLTLAELNNYAVSKIVFATNIKYWNVSMGTGFNASNYVPIIAPVSAVNASSVAISIPVYDLTGNQSAPVEFEIQAKNATAMSLSMTAYGNNGLTTVFGPYAVLQVTYLVGAVLLFAAAFIEISVYDLSLGVITSGISSWTTKKVPVKAGTKGKANKGGAKK